MALTETRQAIEQLRRAERPLIAFRKDWNPDAVASAISLALVLDGLGKKTEITCDGFVPDESLSFLPRLKDIRPVITSLRKFVISVDTRDRQVGELSYEAQDGRLNVYLTPKSGNFEPHHVQFSSTDYQHDLVIVIDTPDLVSLGATHEHATDFLFRTPIVNIDHSPANELYGQVNCVDVKATSSAEVVYGLIKELGHPINEELATALLAGMISKTRSFKDGALTPQSLTAASDLVALGAKRDLIVAKLYRTKTISTLKLWGRTLARMKFDPTLKLVSSVLTRQDFVLAGANIRDLADIVDELISAAPEAETVALIYEMEDGSVCCTVRNDARRNADSLTAPWGGEGTRVQSRCYLKGTPIVEAERDILAHLRTTLAKA
jgi:nanoRNase/pAp phosphatase (c-di-AMP/oligoRNAs hydrolase)